MRWNALLISLIGQLSHSLPQSLQGISATSFENRREAVLKSLTQDDWQDRRAENFPSIYHAALELCQRVAFPVASVAMARQAGEGWELWDTAKAETTPRNAHGAGRRRSASRLRSSLRAMLRLAKERSRQNKTLRLQLLKLKIVAAMETARFNLGKSVV